MRCANCRTENSSDRRFCAECGSALPIPCRQCGFLNQPNVKFCGGCGAAVATAASEPELLSPSKSSRSVLGERLLIGVGSRRRSASQAIDLPSDGGVNLGRLFTDSVAKVENAQPQKSRES
jgi:hypothetical protein